MATILVLAHEYDGFPERTYLLRGFFEHWERSGHRTVVMQGVPRQADADVVVLHVDVSVVPEEFLAFAAGFPVVINRTVRDIRKTAVSRFLVRPGDRWDGRVMVKSNFNSGGTAEALHNTAAALRQRPLPYPTFKLNKTYRIYQSVAEVPDAVWSDPHLVVERFTPEQDDKGYWRRTWTFFGDREQCSRYCVPTPTSFRATDREPAPVPDELRAERKRLGFDYGKFEFVIHRGKAVLFDANRTPAATGGLELLSSRSLASLAMGIETFVRAAQLSREDRPSDS